MMRDRRPALLAALLLAVSAAAAGAQPDAPKAPKAPKPPRDSAAVDTTPRRLFRDQAPLKVTITTDLKKFVRMRERGRPPLPARLDWVAAGDSGTVNMQVGTRGNFRLNARNCAFPPVRLIFGKDSVKNTVFKGQKRLKLVTRCDEGREYEQYILQEYALYRVYNLLTPYSFRARLVQVSYRDQLGKEKPIDTWAFLIEDDGDLAERMGGKITDAKNAVFDDVNLQTMSIVSLYEYLIGNTDWSLGALHNIKLVMMRDATVHAVAYDFDHSGAVDARYATVDAKLPIKQVTDRLYRGRCLTPDQLQPMLDLFNGQKAAIYALYDSIPGLRPDVAQKTREFYDEFYETLNDPRARKRRIIDECKPIGN